MVTLAILGNGISRTSLVDEIKTHTEVWVCNKGYTEIDVFPNISRVFSVHKEMREQAIKDKGNHDYEVVVPQDSDPGWSTGSLALLYAVRENRFDHIYLFGFDFGGGDIYQPFSLEGGNFKKQYDTIIEKYGSSKITLRYPDNFFDIQKIEYPVVDHSLKKIDLGDLTYGKSKLKELLLNKELWGYKIYGSGDTDSTFSTGGRLVDLLAQDPRPSKGGWYFTNTYREKNTDLNSSEEEYEQYLRGKKIVFVGPSPILEGKGRGLFIDSHDVVVRTNNMANLMESDSYSQLDYGKKADVLYINVTYERDSQQHWMIEKWEERGLKFLCRSLGGFPKYKMGFRWRRIKPVGNNAAIQGVVNKLSPSIGVKLIKDLLSYPIGSLHVMGIDGYIRATKFFSNTDDEYIEGYLSKENFDVRRRHEGIAQPNHNKYHDAIEILSLLKDPRLTIEEESLKALEEVASHERY